MNAEAPVATSRADHFTVWLQVRYLAAQKAIWTEAYRFFARVFRRLQLVSDNTRVLGSSDVMRFLSFKIFEASKLCFQRSLAFRHRFILAVHGRDLFHEVCHESGIFRVGLRGREFTQALQQTLETASRGRGHRHLAHS